MFLLYLAEIWEIFTVSSSGGILLVIALVIFMVTYFLLVRSMKSLVSLSLDGDRTSELLSRDLPYVPWCTEYLWIIIGAGITVLVQSSSIMTSALVPLVSSKVLTLERAYPITLGANLGTTTTSLIAALSFQMEVTAFRLSLCHFFFNLAGILAFFVLPQTRVPLFIARKFGEKAIKFKWFSIFYIVTSFFLLPLCFYGWLRNSTKYLIFDFLSGLSQIHPILMYTVAILAVVLLFFVISVNYLQDNKPEILPYFLKTWKFLPKSLRTLRTVDFVVQTYMEVYCCCFVRRTVAAVPVLGGFSGKVYNILIYLYYCICINISRLKTRKSLWSEQSNCRERNANG